MPTMPPRVRAIKQAIESRGDFTGLAHGGEAQVFEWAKANGMRGSELVIEWQRTYLERQAVSTQAANTRRHSAAAPASAEVSSDLDCWPVEVEAEAQDNDEEDDGTCEACEGTGRDPDGGVCTACRGTGRVPIPADDEEDGDEDVEE